MAAPKRNNDDETYYNLKLKTTEGIINSINRIANMVINNKLDNQTANTLNNLAKTNLSALRLSQLEDEVERLRDLLQELEDNKED